MYFILSKILLFLIYPVLWVFALLIISLLTKNSKRKKRFLIAAIITLYIFSAPVFIHMMAKVWSVNTAQPKAGKTYSCAIVLGGYTTEGKNCRDFFNGSSDRFIQGLLAYKTGKVSHILITGGNSDVSPDAYRESIWVKKQLDSLQIPDSAILVESNARNTIENASFSKPILQKAGLKPPYLLITSDFHMRRSAMIFRNQGYDFVPAPADYTGGDEGFSFYDLVPEGYPVSRWAVYFKEIVGYVVDSTK